MNTLSRRTVLKGLAGTLALALVGCDNDSPDDNATVEDGAAAPGTGTLRVQTVATGLVVPWALAFAPDGRILVTERPGRLRVISAQGALAAQPLGTIPDVAAEGEGGLLGLALDPAFATNRRLYFYQTYRAGGRLQNRVVRFEERDGALSSVGTLILDGIPGAGIHDGGRIAFGPDGKLYITTGDASQPALAQDRASLAGKILRLNPDGSVPADNPFAGSPVYSFGHRNPQGLAWHPDTRQLYATEHGPTGNDELNLIEAGRNYGWPQVQGANHGAFTAPLAVYESVIAPSGATWYSASAIPQWQGSLLFANLRGTHLRRVIIDRADPKRVTAQERIFDGTHGRLRDVQQGPDGAVYLLTSNRDGRGNPASDDDRVLRITTS